MGTAERPRAVAGAREGQQDRQDLSGSCLASGQLAGFLPFIQELSKNIPLPHI